MDNTFQLSRKSLLYTFTFDPNSIQTCIHCEHMRYGYRWKKIISDKLVDTNNNSIMMLNIGPKEIFEIINKYNDDTKNTYVTITFQEVAKGELDGKINPDVPLSIRVGISPIIGSGSAWYLIILDRDSAISELDIHSRRISNIENEMKTLAITLEKCTVFLDNTKNNPVNINENMIVSYNEKIGNIEKEIKVMADSMVRCTKLLDKYGTEINDIKLWGDKISDATKR